MSDEFEEAVTAEFEKLNPDKFSVILIRHHLFLCGGLVDATAPIPPSFRDRFVSYTAKKYSDIEDTLLFAETFKDYFKEYTDLLSFEDEISN